MTKTIESNVAERMGETADPHCGVLFWRVLVEPVPPMEETGSGIILPEEVQKADRTLTCIGRIAQVGPLAFQAKTNAGLNLSHDDNAKNARPGRYAVYGQYAGQKLAMRDGREYVVLADTDILALTDEPDQFVNYV